MPYATAARYPTAKKQRFHTSYQAQGVTAAQVVTVALNSRTNRVRVTTTAGVATCRLRNAANLVMFDTSAIPGRDALIFVGTGTNTLEITNSAIATLGISQQGFTHTIPVVVAPAFDFATGSGVALSLRRSVGYSGFLFRIRRSSDSTQIDCNSVDDAVAFVGANNGFVVTMYDQSGNGQNATSAGVILISSGTLVTNNSKAALASTVEITGGNNTSFFTLPSQTSTNVCMVLRKASTDIAQTNHHYWVLGHDTLFNFSAPEFFSQGWFSPDLSTASIITGLLRVNGIPTAITGVARAIGTTTVMNMAMNGTAQFSQISRDRAIAGRGIYGYWQELISFNSVPTAARLTEIESNQTGFYL